MRKLICVSLFIFFFGCEQKSVYNYKATKQCNNFYLSIGRLFPKETIYLYYNDEMILKYKVDSLYGFGFRREFCINYTKDGILKIVSEYDTKKYIDTTINVKKKYSRYLLTLTLPHPKDWKNYYENNSPLPTKEWGYLPIDKSIRLITFRPDTSVSWECQVK